MISIHKLKNKELILKDKVVSMETIRKREVLAIHLKNVTH